MQAAQLMMMMPTANISGDVVISGLNAEQPEQGSWFGQLLGDNLATDLGEAVSKQPIFSVPLAKTDQADPLKPEELNVNVQLAALLAGNLMPEQLTAYLQQSGVVMPAIEQEFESQEPDVHPEAVQAEAVQAVTVDTATQYTARPEMLEVNKLTEQVQQPQPVTAEAVKLDVAELVKPEAVETARPAVVEADKVAVQPVQQQPQQVVQPTEVSKPDAVVPQQAQPQPVAAEAVKLDVAELVKPEVVETARPVLADVDKVAVQPVQQQPQQPVQPTEVSKPDAVVPQQPQTVTVEAVKLDVAELVKPEAVKTARPVLAEADRVTVQPMQQQPQQMVQPTEVSKPDAVVPQQPQPVTAEAVKPEMQQQAMDVEKTATPATAVKQAQSAPEQQVVTQQQPAETDKVQANVVQQPVKFAQQPDVVVAAASSNNQQEMKQDQQEQSVLQGKPLAETAVQEKPVLAETGQETTGQTRGMEQHIALNHVDKPVQTQQTQQVAEAPQPHRQEPVARQVAEHLSGHNFKPGTEQVTLKLSPENLGNLQLNISMDDNRLRLDIVADTRVARDALLQQADELRESLSRQNIKVDSFNVTTGNGGSQYQHQQFANWQQAMPQQKQHQPQYAPTRHQNYPEEVAGGGVQYFAPQYQSTINIIS